MKRFPRPAKIPPRISANLAPFDCVRKPAGIFEKTRASANELMTVPTITVESP